MLADQFEVGLFDFLAVRFRLEVRLYHVRAISNRLGELLGLHLHLLAQMLFLKPNLFHLSDARVAEPVGVRNLVVAKARVVRYLEVAVVADHQVVLVVLAKLSANVAHLCKLVDEVVHVVLTRRVNLYFVVDLAREGTVLVQLVDLGLAEWANVVVLGPADDALEAEDVTAASWLGAI